MIGTRKFAGNTTARTATGRGKRVTITLRQAKHCFSHKSLRDGLFPTLIPLRSPGVVVVARRHTVAWLHRPLPQVLSCVPACTISSGHTMAAFYAPPFAHVPALLA